MGENWFAPEELVEMSRPTMERAIEALEEDRIDDAKELCAEMRHEWRFLHDAMAEMMLGLISFVQERLGDDGVAAAWKSTMERGWKKDVSKILSRDRRDIVKALAATWRAHSTSGVGPEAGRFEIEEDEEKFTFRMNPCGSGQRLWKLGKYEGDDAYGVTEAAHGWSFDREEFPLYCTHCAFMNEILPIRWYGTPAYPSEPPRDFDHDPCVWYWYKNSDDIPDEYWERHGLQRDQAG